MQSSQNWLVLQMHFSDSKRVVLKGLTLKSTGLYRCEVSAEAPDFASVQGDGRMEVVCKWVFMHSMHTVSFYSKYNYCHILVQAENKTQTSKRDTALTILIQLSTVFPRDGPHIRGKQRHYQVGDTLSLNCSSGKSHPASTLQWFINDVEVCIMAVAESNIRATL